MKPKRPRELVSGAFRKHRIRQLLAFPIKKRRVNLHVRAHRRAVAEGDFGCGRLSTDFHQPRSTKWVLGQHVRQMGRVEVLWRLHRLSPTTLPTEDLMSVPPTETLTMPGRSIPERPTARRPPSPGAGPMACGNPG